MPNQNERKVFDVASGDIEAGEELIAAADVPDGKAVRVLAFEFMADAECDVVFKDDDGQAVSPVFFLAERGGIQAPVNQLGWFDQVVGSGLTIEGSAAARVSGVLVYTFVS